MSTNRGLIIAGFALLSVVALAGWTRTPSAGPAYFHSGAVPAAYNQQALQNPCVDPRSMMAVYDQQPIAYTGYGAPVYGTPAMYMPMAQAPAPVYRQQAPRVERVIERRYAPARTTNSVARNKRSTGKSVAIVAGSAGLGAAIGALAGGGKGAALGALAGGGGGFVYDQLTRNR